MTKITISDPDGMLMSNTYEIRGNKITLINNAIGKVEYPKTFEDFINHLIDIKAEGFNVEVKKVGF